MSFTARFDLPVFYDDEDTPCQPNCPHRWGECENAGRCLIEEEYE